KPFYESLGYKAEGEEYLDEGCPHVIMRKKL
ncbi:GNAT family N-acetyltransferase, partial [Veillonella atypica]